MFQTGSQINPSLGRTDYSAYAQGAIAGGQAIGQGIANLGQGIASGIEQYAKQKKENKQLEAKLKGSIVALEGLGQIAKGVSPEADASYTGLMSKLNDPSISITEKVALSDAAQGTLKELISFGIEANTKRDAATATNLALASAKSGKPIPSIYSPEIMAQAGKQAYEFAATQAQIDEITAKKNALNMVKPTETVYDNPAAAIAAGSNALQLSNVQGYDVLPTREAGGFGYKFVEKAPPPVAPVGYKFNPDGTLGIIAGGPVDVEQKAEKAKLATESTEKQAELLKTYADTSDSALRNLNKIKTAADIIRDGNVSTGLGSGLAEFFRGSSANNLKSALTSIKSSLAIDKIIELKKSSKSGSTGFGALNLEELKALQSDIANLDQTQSDSSLINGLNSVYNRYSKIVAALPEEYQFDVPPFAATARATAREASDKVDANQYANPNAASNVRKFRSQNNLQ